MDDLSKNLADSLTRAIESEGKPVAEVMVVEFLTDRRQPVKLAVECNQDGEFEIALTVYTGSGRACMRMDAESAETLIQTLELGVAGLMREQVQLFDNNENSE